METHCINAKAMERERDDETTLPGKNSNQGLLTKIVIIMGPIIPSGPDERTQDNSIGEMKGARTISVPASPRTKKVSRTNINRIASLYIIIYRNTYIPVHLHTHPYIMMCIYTHIYIYIIYRERTREMCPSPFCFKGRSPL